jgi:calcineurin-like phosphoesterase family protein
MSNVWFCSDLHLGHKNIGKFRAPLVNSTEENTERIFNDWKSHVTKRDVVYVLGDFCFDRMLWQERILDELKADKIYLVRGNHDDKFSTDELLDFFDDVFGITRYKKFWLTHAPIHPNELRGRVNLHGHVHYAILPDKRYFNCCPENLWPTYGRCLVSLDELRQCIVS